MSEPGVRYPTSLVTAFPLALLAGVQLDPVVPDDSDHAQAARAATSSGRWLAGQIVCAEALGIAVAAVAGSGLALCLPIGLRS